MYNKEIKDIKIVYEKNPFKLYYIYIIVFYILTFYYYMFSYRF